MRLRLSWKRTTKQPFCQGEKRKQNKGKKERIKSNVDDQCRNVDLVLWGRESFTRQVLPKRSNQTVPYSFHKQVAQKRVPLSSNRGARQKKILCVIAGRSSIFCQKFHLHLPLPAGKGTDSVPGLCIRQALNLRTASDSPPSVSTLSNSWI